MENPLRVGDRVKVNPIYRTGLVQGLVGGKVGIVEKIHIYPNMSYKIKYDEPYTHMGDGVVYDYYYAEELIKLRTATSETGSRTC